MKQNQLTIAPNLKLPLEAVTQTFAILAVRGAGKSNTGAVMAEEMFACGLPFVVIDPVGSWYGLRSSADGKAPGLPIPIFGGKHGDLPLERSAGTLLAELVTGKRLSCVLDLSGFESEAAKKAFLLDFAQTLYQRNENPLHLFLEEADDYIPQKPMRDETKLLRAWENIVRRGRARGLGMTLITQRSAVINKNVLTQIETLFAMRTTGPQDIAAIEAWIKYHAQGREVLSTLAGLRDGEAWLWSPHWLGKMERVQIRRRSTFDSGATPKNVRGGETRGAATLADIDLSAIEREMAATVERAKADDPRELKKRIAQLEKELNGKLSTPAKADENAIRAAVEAEQQKLLREFQRKETAYQLQLDELRRRVEAVLTQAHGLQAVLDKVVPIEVPTSPTVTFTPRPVEKGKPDKPSRSLRPDRVRHSDGHAVTKANGFQLSKKQQQILDALAWLESIGHSEASNAQIGALALIDASGGHFSNVVSPLSSQGLIERGAGKLRLTDAGREFATIPEEVGTLDDYHDVLRVRVRRMKSAGGKTIEILNAVIGRHGAEMTTAEIGAEVGIDPTGGHFSNMIGPLGTVGLIERRNGIVRPTEILFPPGLA